MPRRRKKTKPQPVAPVPLSPVISARVRALGALGVFVALLTVYRLTILPTMVDQDSGELAAAAHVLGITHPTGYPLWTMLGRLFDLLPLGGTSAYRVAMLSAVSAAAAGGILTWLVMTLAGAMLPGVFAGLVFGLWFPTWSQAVLTEVYATSGLLFSLFLVALWGWSRERTPRSLFWFALVGGAVSMHHRTAFLSVAPPLAMAFWLTAPRGPKTWVVGALLFLAPFACYLYLPIRAAMHPPVNWTNPSTVERFYTHAMGLQYTHFALQNSFGEAMKQAAKLLGECLAGGIGAPPPGTPFASPEPVLLNLPALRLLLSTVLMLIGLPLLAWGWWSWYRRQRPEALSVAVGCVVLCLWVVEWGETSDLKVFLLPLGAVLALCGGLGAAQVRTRRGGRPGRIAAAALGGLIVALLFGANWSRSDRSDQWRYRDEWYGVLSQMDKNAIFVTDFDVPSFATLYLQEVEGLRKDITSLRSVGMMQPWYVDLIQDEELRRTADAAWQEVSAQLGITGSGTPQFWQGSARFAWRLAQHYRGRRPVYALHGPYGGEIPGPPYFVGLSEDLVKLDFAKPEMLRKEARQPIATFPGGVELVSFDLLSAREVGAGSLVPFRAMWRTGSPPAYAQFAIRLAPDRVRKYGGEIMSPAEKLAFLDKGRFLQGFPLLYGLRDLLASPPGTAYEQRGTLIIPSNAGAHAGVGTYTVEASFSAAYPPQYGQWIEVLGRDSELIAKNRPGFPANGP